MKKLALAVAVVMLGAVALIATAFARHGGGGGGGFHAGLDGFSEVPSVSTTGSGTFSARLENSNTLRYRLTFRDLEGGAAAAAHIHLGERHTEGGIIVHLCDTSPTTPTPACTSPVEGTLTAANVVGPSAQGIDPAESDRFEEMIRAMRHGATYVNVHNATYPDGEIRGQIKGGGGHFKVIVIRGKGKDD
jgi:CHRD domain